MTPIFGSFTDGLMKCNRFMPKRHGNGWSNKSNSGEELVEAEIPQSNLHQTPNPQHGLRKTHRGTQGNKTSTVRHRPRNAPRHGQGQPTQGETTSLEWGKTHIPERLDTHKPKARKGWSPSTKWEEAQRGQFKSKAHMRTHNDVDVDNDNTNATYMCWCPACKITHGSLLHSRTIRFKKKTETIFLYDRNFQHRAGNARKWNMKTRTFRS